MQNSKQQELASARPPPDEKWLEKHIPEEYTHNAVRSSPRPSLSPKTGEQGSDSPALQTQWKHVSSPLNQWNLGAPIVEGPRDEDLLASFRPADNGGPGLLGGLHRIIQVLLPRYKLFVPGEL